MKILFPALKIVSIDLDYFHPDISPPRNPANRLAKYGFATMVFQSFRSLLIGYFTENIVYHSLRKKLKS